MRRAPAPRARHSARATAARGALLGTLLAVLAPPSGAQSPSLADLALEWARGSFASPLLCRFGERPVRGVRRVSIEPGRRDLHSPVDRVVFHDLEAGEASRCFDDIGQEQPNLVGTLRIRFAGTPHRATALRDFRVALEREGGFDYAIVDGRLRIEPVGESGDPPRVVDLRGGRARLEQVRPGSDAARQLSGLEARRRLLLTVTSEDGTRIVLPLFDRPAPPSGG